MAHAEHEEIYRLLEDNKPKEALQRAYALASPDDDDPHLGIITALCHEALGETDQAEALLLSITDRDPEAFEAHFHLGRLEVAKGNLADARAAFETCTQLNPNHAGAWTWRGRVAMLEGHPTQAASDLRTALKADPEHIPALTDLAGIQLQLGQLEQAQATASQAVQLDPDNAATQLALAETLVAQGYWGFAEQSLSNALKLDPENPRVHWAWANFLQKVGRHEEALAGLDNFQKLGQSHPRLARARAISLRKTHRTQQAIAAWVDLLETGQTDTELVLELATLYALEHRRDDLQALKARIDHPGLKQWLDAQLAGLDNDLERAEQLARALLEQTDERLKSSAQLLLIEILSRQGDAQQPMTEAVEQWLKDRLSTEAEIYWLVAQRCRQAKLPALAIKTLEHLIRYHRPDDAALARTHCLIGNVCDETDQIDMAVEHLVQGGWQTPYLGGRFELEQDLDALSQKIDALTGSISEQTKARALEGPKLIAILGWPMTGRDLMLSALSFAPHIKALSLNDWPARRKTIAPLLDSDAVDEAKLVLMHRHYFKSVRPFDAGMNIIEPAALSPIELASLIHLHPNIQWVAMTASPEYVVSHWRLMGYRQIPTMMAYWERDQTAIEHLKHKHPNTGTAVDLEALLTAPEQTLTSLCDTLGLSFASDMVQAIETHQHTRGYRPYTHIAKYQADLMPKSKHDDTPS